MEDRWIAFMGAIEHVHFDYLETVIKEYDIGGYIISAETASASHTETNGEHFHFLVQICEKDYTRFAKRVFIDKFALRGRAVKGKPRQYGKVAKIENLEKMKTYTVKDGNFRTNLSDDEIKEYVESSFVKDEKRKILDELLDEMLEEHSSLEWFDVVYGINDNLHMQMCARNYALLVRYCICWFLEKEKQPPPPSTYKGLILKFIHRLKKYTNQDKSVILMVMMDIKNPFN